MRRRFLQTPQNRHASGRGYFKYAEDITGDGKLDLIGQDLNANDNFSRRVIVVPGDGSGGFTAPIYLTVPSGLQFTGFSVGDIDGDGLKDVLVFVMNSFTQIYFKNNGNGSITPHSLIQGNVGGDPPFFQDFKGDNKVDIVTTYNGSNLFFGNGDGTFGSGTQLCGGEVTVAADFTGDGKTDFAGYSTNQVGFGAARPTIFDNAVVSVEKNVCDRPGQTKIVDFNRDGQTDYLFWQASTGNWSYRTSPGTAVSNGTFQWGSGALGDVPVVGDFDRDGITDAGVFRAPSGTWYIRRSSNLSMLALQFGASGDKPVPADYDGDGKADPAVYRNEGSSWYILRSYDFSYGVLRFGLFQDFAQPGDYNGDGVFDAGIYRSVNGLWFASTNQQADFAVSGGTPMSFVLKVE